MFYESKRFTGNGTEVKVGAREQHLTNNETIRFAFFAVCDSVNPEAWHGEVVFGSTVLLTTGPTKDENAAIAQAQLMLRDRIVQVFTGADS